MNRYGSEVDIPVVSFVSASSVVDKTSSFEGEVIFSVKGLVSLLNFE